MIPGKEHVLIINYLYVQKNINLFHKIYRNKAQANPHIEIIYMQNQPTHFGRDIQNKYTDYSPAKLRSKVRSGRL